MLRFHAAEAIMILRVCYYNSGCVEALALDGGGSSTFAAKPEGSDKLEVRNSPADGAERAVSSSLLIVSTGKPTGVFSHARLTPNNELYTPGSEVQFEATGVDTGGAGIDIPKGTTWALADNSKDLGKIDASTGKFTAGSKTGTVTVNLLNKDNKVIGETSIEVVTPDQIYFDSDEVSLGFEDTSDLGIIVRSKGRDINYKAGDIKWEVSDEKMGSFDGNIFHSSDGNSVTGKVKAVSAYDAGVSGEITVIVGKLPTVVWDFEDKTDESGNVIKAKDYYIGTQEKPGILTHSNYGRGGKESIDIVSIDDEEPVRFGAKSLKLDYDFINCGEVTEGACVGTTEGMEIPGTPTKIGVWVYAPEGVGIKWEGEGSQSGLWLRGYVRNGSGSNVPYDFTLEPKKVVSEVNAGNLPPETQPGIYWEGWKYLEADLSTIQPPYSIQPGMTFRLMFVHGTKMGTRTANSLYFDNLQFVYGTNVDDIDEPSIKSITLNGTELEDGAVINSSKVSIDAILRDAEGKYATGIDDSTVRMYIDGINVVDNEKYQYVYDSAGDMAHLYDVKLRDGKHSVTVKGRDGFGNEVSETRNFTIDTQNVDESTYIKITPTSDTAIIGKTVDLQIKASDNTVTESTTIFRLGNYFKDYKVKFSENYEGKAVYSKQDKTITIKATRKQGSAVEDDNIIATLTVDIPSDLKKTDSFSYTIKGGSFETSGGGYDTYSETKKELPIDADYSISADPAIIGGTEAEIKVFNSSDKPVGEGIGIYLADDDSLIGETDKDGILKTDRFNGKDAEAGDHVIYAKDKDNGRSFQYKLHVYAAQGDATGLSHNVRFNKTDDPATQKNITWFSYPLNKDKQVIKYAVSGTDNWQTVEANTEQIQFNSGGNKTINVNAVLLTGLTPNTSYDYIIGTDKVSAEKGTFSTIDGGKKTNDFFIIGDIQDPDKGYLKTVVEQINKKGSKYDFGVQIGDAIDQATDYNDWSDLGEILGAKMLGGTDMISIMGNHEYYGDSNADISSKIYNNPVTSEGSCYSVEYGDVYVAVMNFSNTRTPIEKAAKWLVEDASKSNATWKILCSHQPAYYTNNGGNEPVYELIPAAAEKAGIDAVFSGHDHSYGVTNLLKNNEVNEKEGIVYYLVGAAGHKRYALGTQDKFDYNKIFKKVSDQYTSTYLTVSSNQDEMKIDLYDIDAGLLDTVVLKSKCKKNGHKCVYDPQNNELRCSVCNRIPEKYTGEALDKDKNEYYFLSGKLQTGWVSVGEEIRYYGENGVREKVTKDEKPSTCIIDGYCIYKSESGAEKKINYTDAGGHDYEEKGGKYICSKCGWERFEMSDCDVTLSYDVCTYTGKARTPATKAVDPKGNVLTKRPAEFPDYASKYENNVEVGTATVTMTAFKYATYVDMNSWRGNYKGSVTVKYEIRPDAPKKAKLYYENGKDVVKWEPAQMADEYVIYQSVNNGDWKEIGVTDKTSFILKGIDKNKNYKYRVGTRKTAKDGKSYESLKYAEAKMLSVKATASKRKDDGKPTLKWNKIDGATYTVFRSTKKTGKYKKVFTTKGSTYTHVSATPGKTYYYKVNASANGKTAVSSVVSAKCGVGKPVITKNSKNTEGKPILAWKSIKGVTKYEVYRAEKKTGKYTKMFTTRGTTYTNTSAKVGKTYYYKVKVLAGSNVSAFSDVVSCKCAPAKPVITKNSNNADGKPTLAWKKVKGATNYEVYRANKKTGKYVKVFTTKGTTYTNTSAKSGNTYYYKVKAVKLDGKEKLSSVYSKIVSRKCK